MRDGTEIALNTLNPRLHSLFNCLFSRVCCVLLRAGTCVEALGDAGTRARRAGSRCAMGPLANPSDESGGGAGDARFERLGRRCGVTCVEPSDSGCVASSSL